MPGSPACSTRFSAPKPFTSRRRTAGAKIDRVTRGIGPGQRGCFYAQVRMTDRPLYPKVVAGYEDNERGEDARVLAERIVARDGGELKVIHVEKGSPADTLGALAERGDADLIVLGSTHRAHIGSVSPGNIAEHLLQGARCRLVIAPKGYALEDHSGDRLRVLAVGYGGGGGAPAAGGEGAGLCLKFGGSMKVMGGAPRVPAIGAAAAARAGGEAGPDSQTRLHEAVA